MAYLIFSLISSCPLRSHLLIRNKLFFHRSIDIATRVFQVPEICRDYLKKSVHPSSRTHLRKLQMKGTKCRNGGRESYIELEWLEALAIRTTFPRGSPFPFASCDTALYFYFQVEFHLILFCLLRVVWSF